MIKEILEYNKQFVEEKKYEKYKTSKYPDKKIDTKITIASGGYKAQTVLSALKGKLIDVLIIDYQLGRRIMELYRTEAEK